MQVLNRFIKLYLLLFVMFLMGTSVKADEIRPALIVVKELDTGVYDVMFKIPASGDQTIKLNPIFPEGFEPLGPVVFQVVPGALVQRFTLHSKTGQKLFGKEIIFEGLALLQIDVVVQMEFNDGTSISAIVLPKSPVFKVPERGSSAQVAGSYFNMGVFHILSGIDHLLFVLALLLIVVDFKKLLKTITAFTLAHSVTLAMASLGLVNVPSAPTEAIIALSIVFLFVEIIKSKQGKKSITERYPWIVAMIFGLFHGLGFAGALSEVGLPPHEIPLSLLMFNVGVEVGQIMFIAAVLIIKLLIDKMNINWPKGSWKLMPYILGSIAAYWVIERTILFL